jgi:hypothetical protein
MVSKRELDEILLLQPFWPITEDPQHAVEEVVCQAHKHMAAPVPDQSNALTRFFTVPEGEGIGDCSGATFTGCSYHRWLSNWRLRCKYRMRPGQCRRQLRPPPGSTRRTCAAVLIALLLLAGRVLVYSRASRKIIDVNKAFINCHR